MKQAGASWHADDYQAIKVGIATCCQSACLGNVQVFTRQTVSPKEAGSRSECARGASDIKHAQTRQAAGARCCSRRCGGSKVAALPAPSRPERQVWSVIPGAWNPQVKAEQADWSLAGKCIHVTTPTACRLGRRGQGYTGQGQTRTRCCSRRCGGTKVAARPAPSGSPAPSPLPARPIMGMLIGMDDPCAHTG